jgi:prepilin-type N-terminal cleavage/methylation domain-containing protein
MHINKKGFTLIELLVIVLIIGILAAIALPQYQRAIEKTRATEAIIAIKNIQEAKERYRLVTGEYPSSFDQLDISYPNLKQAIGGGDFMLSNLFVIYFNYLEKNILLDRRPESGRGGDYRYVLIYCPVDKSVWCGASSSEGSAEKQKKLCQSLGGVLGTLPDGCVTNRDYDYKL